MQLASESRLKFVYCKCKSISKNACCKNLCSCRKHGLNCRNSVDIIEEEYNEDMFERKLFDLFRVGIKKKILFYKKIRY